MEQIKCKAHHLCNGYLTDLHSESDYCSQCDLLTYAFKDFYTKCDMMKICKNCKKSCVIYRLDMACGVQMCESCISELNVIRNIFYTHVERQSFEDIMIRLKMKKEDDDPKVILKRYQFLYSHYDDYKLQLLKKDHKRHTQFILNHAPLGVEFIFEYIHMINYDFYECSCENITLLFYIDYVLPSLFLEEEQKVAGSRQPASDHIKYILDTIEEEHGYKLTEIILNRAPLFYKRACEKKRIWAIDYIFYMIYKYKPESLNSYIDILLEHQSQIGIRGIANLLKCYDLYSYLNDRCHLKLIKMIIWNVDIEPDLPTSYYMPYLDGFIRTKYKFEGNTILTHLIGRSTYNHNYHINEVISSFLIMDIYILHEALFIYLIESSLSGNMDDSLKNILNHIISSKKYDTLARIFQIMIAKHVSFDLYDIITAHIDDHSCIDFFRTHFRTYFQKYIDLKKQSSYDMEGVAHRANGLRFSCLSCSQYNHPLNIIKKRNPIYYVCNECMTNLHDHCLHALLKDTHHKGRIRQCICCKSRRIQIIRLDTCELKYILYSKILKNEI